MHEVPRTVRRRVFRRELSGEAGEGVLLLANRDRLSDDVVAISGKWQSERTSDGENGDGRPVTEHRGHAEAR